MTASDRLYNLLPVIYRLRDSEQGEPLRALLSIVSDELASVEADITGLYENWFIETSDEWVVPYIGDLLAVRGLNTIKATAFSQRAYVANTLFYRRRKGTAYVLEILAKDVTGWPAQAVEFFELLQTTQYLNHRRLFNTMPDLRDVNRLNLLDTPFDSQPHTADVRHIHNRRGKHNIPNIGLFLWRLQNYPLEKVSPRQAEAPHAYGYHFSPIGNPAPLFNIPIEDGTPDEQHVPAPIRPLDFYFDLKTYFDQFGASPTPPDNSRYFGPQQRSLNILIGGRPPVLPEEIMCKNLSSWDRPPAGKIAVDVRLGRITFAAGEEPQHGIQVSYNYGFSADIGGGPYDRRERMAQIIPGVIDELSVGEGKTYATLASALTDWADPVKFNKSPAVIRIYDSATYDANLTIDLPKNGMLVIDCENGERPTLLDAMPLKITSAATTAEETAAFTLNGLLIEGSLELSGKINLTLGDCTLIPGLALDEDGYPKHSDKPSILVSGSDVTDTSLLISRSILMVMGTLIACTIASALTLILSREFDVPIGPLTANLSTIVFVLTLTHMVFMTFNWKHIIRKKETSPEDAWRRAVRVTLLPSSWSMLTALLGFLSLLIVPATPLRQLGLSGAMGTVIAFASAYVIYPFFLRIQTPGLAARDPSRKSFFQKRHGRIVAVILLAVAAASPGLGKLNTEPSLFSYFKKDGDLRNSLEYIDQNGGSSPLDIVISNQDGAPMKMKKDYPRLWQLQIALEKDPAVGSIMSLPLLLSEAKQSFPASVVPVGWILKALESPLFGKSAVYYMTKDQTKTLFLLRMKESYRKSDHLANIERLKRIVREHGFRPVLVGGTYLLYGKLSKLVASSMVEGLTILILLFIIMGGIISRSLRVIGAMFIGLATIPLLMLGILGHFRVPIDIISAPGANIAIGIGVDAMIHTLIWVKRHPAGDMRSWKAWADVCSRLSRPILYSMSVVCAGFGIFVLSGFPPTQRFGLSVVLGTLISPLPALFVVPWFATLKHREESDKLKTGEFNE